MHFQTGARRLVLLLAILVASGCSSSEPYSPGPPEGWVADGARWFTTALDTTGVFPDLTSLESMDVVGAELTYSATASL